MSSKYGDPEGIFLVYLFLQQENLSYLDANGRVDDAKYNKLASRTMPERTIDTDAMDSLYRAADKNYPWAVAMMATTLGGRLGDGNRKKLNELLKKIPDQMKSAVPGLQAYAKISSQMESLGESFATPQLFADSQAQAMVAAMVKGCGLDAEKAKKTKPKLISTKISKPLSNAVYLPSNVTGYEKAYLVSGIWEEEWKYEVCEKSVDVALKFLADGLGGATFLSEQTIKANDK